MAIKQLSAGDIVAIREASGLTQKEYCDKFSLNLRTYQGWECGRRKASPTVCILLQLLPRLPPKAIELLADLKADLTKRK